MAARDSGQPTDEERRGRDRRRPASAALMSYRRIERSNALVAVLCRLLSDHGSWLMQLSERWLLTVHLEVLLGADKRAETACALQSWSSD